MTGAPAYTVLVNTSDGYEDCWVPFFTLLAKYWPQRSAPVLLNTEYKNWRSEHTELRCVRNGNPGAWSACLLAALREVKTPLVLYLQEDYFLHAPVRHEVIEALAQQMLADPSIRHIGLTHFGAYGPFQPTAQETLWEIARRSRYRISTQAGLWRVDALASYLQADENGWMFEIFGSWRARARNEKFLTVNRERFGPGARVMDYVHTGIIKARWHPAMPEIFSHNGIAVDFSSRGFYREPPWLLRKIETARKLFASPRLFLRALAARVAK